MTCAELFRVVLARRRFAEAVRLRNKDAITYPAESLHILMFTLMRILRPLSYGFLQIRPLLRPN